MFILSVRNVAVENYRKRDTELLESEAEGSYFSLSAIRCYATFNNMISEKSQSCFYFLVTISSRFRFVAIF